MYKLIYKKQFVPGFDADQVVGNLAQLLQLKPKTVRLLFLSDRPSVIKVLESATEVEQWRAAFLDAGAYLDVVSIAVPDADSIADQIELELELHSLDDDEDDEFELPRQFLVRKIIQVDEPDAGTDGESKSESASVDSLKESQIKPAVEPAATKPEPVAPAASVAAAVSPTVGAQDASAPQPTKSQAKTAQAPVNSPDKSPPKVAKVDQVATKAAASVDLKSKAEPSASIEKTAGNTPAPDAKAEAEPKAAAPVKAETAVKPAAVGKSAPKKRSGPDTPSVPVTQPAPETKTATGNTAVAGVTGAPQVDALADVKIASAAKQQVNAPETKPEPGLNPEQELLADHQGADAVIDDGHLDVDFHKSSFLWGMLVILLAIILTSSIILYLKRPLWSPATVSPHSEQVVKALATESLFALAHVDVPRVQQLPDVLQPGAGLNNLPAPAENFWRKLEQSGVDIAKQLDQVWVAAYRANNQTQPLWVLTGKFNAEKIRAWLKENYVIDGDSPEQMVFSSVNQNTCEKSPVLMAMIQPDRIIVGAPERVAAFRGRLDAAAPAERDLTDWQAMSAKQMLTMALFNPAQFGDASSAIALTKLSVDVTQVKGLYVGVAPRMFPPMLEFDAVMVGTNRSFIDGAEASVAPLLANVKNTIAQDWPETLPIYERMTLSKTEQQLRASVYFDEKIQAQLELWANSLLARTFAMADSQVDVAQEQLEEKPRAFTNLPSAELPAFSANKHLNPYFIAQASTGPFGVSISSVDATEQGTVITLDVAAFNLPNLGTATDHISLQVTDIVDHQDKSLLAPTGGCDTTGTRQQAKINMVYEGTSVEQGQAVPYLGLQGTKKIHLPDTIALANIGAIKGELSYTLPVEVERLQADMPLAGKVIDAHGVQVRFLSSNANRLYFQYTGNTDALLQVNALNAAGKVLATTSMRSGEGLLSVGTTTSMDLQGQVAAAEVIVASKLERQTYPFSFGRIQPPEKPFVQEKPTPELLTATSLAALKQDSPPVDIQYPFQTPLQTIMAGPALIAVNQLSIQSQKLNLMADIYIRNQHPLTRQLSAARFVITEVEDSSGNIHSVNYQAPVAMEYSAGAWVEGKYEPDPAQPWLRGQLDLREQDLGVSDVIAFWGKLVFLAAAEPIAIPLPFQFGMQWNGAESTFKLARWEAGRLLFDIHGSFPELMAITALDENGAVVSQAAELRTNFGVSQVELPVRQRPATIEFSIARNQETAEFPFEIRATQ